MSDTNELVLRATWKETDPLMTGGEDDLASQVLGHLDRVPAVAWRLRG